MKTQMYNAVNQHLSDLMMQRSHIIMGVKATKDDKQFVPVTEITTDEDIQKIPLIEKAIDEGRKFYQPIK